MKEIRKIGYGGFGVVHEVEDSDGLRYARKSYSFNQQSSSASLDANARKRFQKEVRLQSGIRHRNIVPIINADLSGDPPSFTMPLAEGSLDEDIRKSRTLNGTYLEALLDIISGLEELHFLDIFHRDLKPQNVLHFSHNNENKEALDFYAISDFGLVSLRETSFTALTTTGMVMGSDFYTAPEITANLSDATKQSDIFSLGCILHDFVGIKSRIPCNEIKEDGEFSAILLNCTRNNPARRFKSVESVREAILAVNTTTIEPQDISDAYNLLDSGNELTKDNWEEIITFIEDNESSPEGDAVLRQLTLSKIEELILLDTSLSNRLGAALADWARDGGFGFGYCDGLADKLERFICSCSISTQAECLMAMLYLGVSHNRWHVERKFFKLTAATMDGSLANRISVEFRADSNKICRLISHLESSIGVSRSSLHPTLVETLMSICK